MKFLCCLLMLIPVPARAQMGIDQVKAEILYITKLTDKEKFNKKILVVLDGYTNHTYEGGATITGFFKNGRLKKITKRVRIQDGYINDEFYLRDDTTLVCVNENETMFEYDDSTHDFRYNKLNTIFSGKYWFWNGGLIDEISTGHNRFENDKEDAEQEFLTMQKKFTLLLYKKYRRLKRK